MAVYLGPREKIERRFGEAIFGLGKAIKKRNFAPGQHGKKRKSRSMYAKQLFEKQKLRFTYGLLEKQFRNTYELASNSKGLTGEVFMQKLECRLDNVVFRLGIAGSRRAARQFVSHRHITVNGKIVNIPSYQLSVNDLISIKEKSKSLVKNISSKSIYEWLDWDRSSMTGRLIAIPTRVQIPESINEQRVVDLYSK